MSTEELRMIMDALSTLGANGKEAFIWWMFISYGSRIVLGLMVLCGVIGVPFVIARAMAAHGERGKALQMLGETVGIKYYPWAEYHSTGERVEDIVAAIRDRLDK